MNYYDVPYGELKKQKADIYVNDKCPDTVVYIHGCGLTGGDKGGNRFLDYLINEGYSVVSVNYRLYPEAKYPDYIEDGARALWYVKQNAKKYGYGERISVIGNSAGAYILSMLLFDGTFLIKYGLKSCDFYAFILNSPQPTVHFNVLKERGVDSRAVIIDGASPIYHVKEGKYPKILLITYECDIFCRKEQNILFSKVMEHFGIPHSFKILKGEHCSAETPDENNEVRMLPLLKSVIQEG